MMLVNIQEKFESLTPQRVALLKHLDFLSPEALSFKAGPAKYETVIEVIKSDVPVDVAHESMQHHGPFTAILDEIPKR